MKLRILQLHFLCSVLTLASGSNLNAESNSCVNLKSSPPPHSTLLPIVERVFSRKKRFLLLPPGGAIKFTANFSKRLLSMYPRGMNYAYEAATYYETITKRSEWLPKFLRERTTTTPKPAGPTRPLYVYIPGSRLRYRAKPAVKPSKVHRMDDDTTVQWIDGKYNNPAYWSKYSRYGNIGQKQRYNWTPVGQQQQYSYHLAPHTNWMSNIKPQQRWTSLENFSYPQYMNSSTEFMSTKQLRHYHGHRERRHLFRSLEGFSNIFGVNMTACILRTICDSHRLLMPPGYSMLQDMMRVIFTMPMHHSSNDEYGHAMSGNVEVCDKGLSQKCPISLITWFLNPVKSI